MRKWPTRWTSTTERHSCGSALNTIESHRNPALLIRMSSPPNVSTAWRTRLSAPATSLTSSKLAAARPPPATISAATSDAGRSSLPSPCQLPPMSFTRTAAPSPANDSASPRPMPRPAPLTIATFPSSLPMRLLALLLERPFGGGGGRFDPLLAHDAFEHLAGGVLRQRFASEPPTRRHLEVRQLGGGEI